MSAGAVGSSLRAAAGVHLFGGRGLIPGRPQQVKAFAFKAMKTKDVRIDTGLNKLLWSKGVRNVRFRAAGCQTLVQGCVEAVSRRRRPRRCRAACASPLRASVTTTTRPRCAAVRGLAGGSRSMCCAARTCAPPHCLWASRPCRRPLLGAGRSRLLRCLRPQRGTLQRYAAFSALRTHRPGCRRTCTRWWRWLRSRSSTARAPSPSRTHKRGGAVHCRRAEVGADELYAQQRLDLLPLHMCPVLVQPRH